MEESSNLTPLWIAEAEVVSAIDMAGAIAALERGLEREAQGAAFNMVKTHAAWGGNTLHAIGAVFQTDGLACTKTWVHSERGATPLLILFDSRDGSLKAVIEAFALGQLRTGAISGLATRWLARGGAAEMALIGAGKQALAQLAAVATVRRLKSVRIFSRSEAKAQALAERASAELGIAASVAPSVAQAAEGASIITLVTRASAPILQSAMAARGAHINAVGAIVPERIEFEPRLLERCSVVAVDSVAQVRNLSREFMDYYGGDEGAWGAVLPLSSIIAKRPARSEDTDLTLFKAMGMGIADLSLAAEIYRYANDAGLGRAIAHPQRAAPKLRSAGHVKE